MRFTQSGLFFFFFLPPSKSSNFTPQPIYCFSTFYDNDGDNFEKLILETNLDCRNRILVLFFYIYNVLEKRGEKD